MCWTSDILSFSLCIRDDIRRIVYIMFNRKELSERAVKVLKAHYGIFLIVCLIAAFIGSEFTETFSLFKNACVSI